MTPDTPAPHAGASYSTAAVARRLGVSVPTVQRWVDAGALKAWKTVGGHRRIDAASADAFIRGLSLADTPAATRTAEASLPAVLIVDDNPDDRDLLCAVVAEALPGARIATAENGFEGLLAIGQSPPDVLITDVVMPRMDGIEMQRHVAALGARRPRVLVAVSSLTAADLARRGTLPPGVHFVPKPIEPEVLTSLLRDGLAGKPGAAP